MKLETDSPVLHGPVVQIPVLKTVQHGHGIVDLTKLKAGNKITDERQDVLLHEDKGNIMIAVSLPHDPNDENGFWPVSDVVSCAPSYQDLTGNGNEMVRAADGEDLLQETELLRKELDTLTDKKVVTDFELSGVVIRREEDNSYHEVKDICMDKVVVSDEKMLHETYRDSGPETVLLLDKEARSSPLKEKLEIDSPISDLVDVPEDHSHGDSLGKCRPELLVNPDPEGVQHDTSVGHDSEAEQQSATVLLDESIASSTSTAEERQKGSEEGAGYMDTSGTEPTSPEGCDRECQNKGKEPISECQAEGGTAAFSIAASEQTPGDGHETLGNGNKEMLDNSQDTAPKIEQSHAYFGRDQQSHGESSFSVLTGTPSGSGLISHSGHLPYSGSISMRSDSSTTSTTSFAFPVLQNEWNSSPVRMAKADRRLYRKHSGWGRRLLCCKF